MHDKYWIIGISLLLISGIAAGNLRVDHSSDFLVNAQEMLLEDTNINTQGNNISLDGGELKTAKSVFFKDVTDGSEIIECSSEDQKKIVFLNGNPFSCSGSGDLANLTKGSYVDVNITKLNKTVEELNKTVEELNKTELDKMSVNVPEDASSTQTDTASQDVDGAVIEDVYLSVTYSNSTGCSKSVYEAAPEDSSASITLTYVDGSDQTVDVLDTKRQGEVKENSGKCTITVFPNYVDFKPQPIDEIEIEAYAIADGDYAADAEVVWSE